MAKSFLSKRSPEAEERMEDTIAHHREHLRGVEKDYGKHSPEASVARLILAAHYRAGEHYGDMEPLLGGDLTVAKGTQEANTRRALWARSLRIEAYFNLNRIAEGMRISNEGKSIARNIDMSAADPLLEALLQRAIALEAKGDIKSRQRGFVAALLTLSWYVSHGFERSRADVHVKDQLRLLFESYGISGTEWDWTVKHAHLTRYDFVGLLSILLQQTGLAPTPLHTVIGRRPRIIEVR